MARAKAKKVKKSRVLNEKKHHWKVPGFDAFSVSHLSHCREEGFVEFLRGRNMLKAFVFVCLLLEIHGEHIFRVFEDFPVLQAG